MKNLTRRAAGFLAGAGCITALLVFSIAIVVFNKSFYIDIYQSLDLAQSEQIRQEDLEKSIFAMVDYVWGSREDMEEQIEWKGQTQLAFNEKETAHMVDVKALWQKAALAGILAAVLCAACLLFLFLVSRKHWLAYACRGLLLAYACMAVLLVFFGFWMFIDFSGLWIQFHHLFFSNQLWLLDPATDFMIVICPEALFFKMITAIAGWFGGISLFLVLFSVYYVKRKAVIGFQNL